MNGRRGGIWLAGVLLLGSAQRARAQDTVQVIHPEAKVDSTKRPQLPEEVLREVIAAWNDSATTRIAGSFLLPSGARLQGPLAVFYGPLRVAGELIGRVTVINGNLVIDPGGLVRGEVLVVGGRVVVRPGGRYEATPSRSYTAGALVIRLADGSLMERPPPRPLGELATAHASFRTGHFATDVSIATGRTYNRVEGLPIVLGPTVVREGLPNMDARLDLRGIGWTAPDRSDRRADFGYSARLQLRFGKERRLTVEGQAYRVISPTEDHPLSATEAGWSAFLFQRDYRDYYQSQGVTASLSYLLGHGLSVHGSLQRDAEQSVAANDPISVFRNSAWRPNPLADDGHYLTWRLGLEFDTRNDRETPASGWLAHGFLERSRSDDAAPLSLPGEVRDPIAPGRYAFTRFGLDLRRYARFNPSVRTAARVLAGGWLGGDPLPVQRRNSLGGPDLLPGYSFRSQNCAPAGLTDPARPALCDRYLAVQLEVRTRTRLGLPIPSSDPYLTGLQRIFAIREPDIVIFGDAGKAWITGEGPGRVPNNRIPVLREWEYDVGFGVDAGGLGLYLAQPLTRGQPLTFTLRLQRRF
ncbi:MAG TPA: BamA/TamA family outer membrane protein [Gemmatimonadales bacterium]|nr:BamA/TamA family outer membrane protein [Gemmatimonadales bacterium]